MGFLFAPEPKLVDVNSALPGRPEPILANPREHAVLGTPTTGPWREGQKRVLVGIGLVVSLLAAVLMERRTRKTYVDRGERADGDEWSFFDDEQDEAKDR